MTLDRDDISAIVDALLPKIRDMLQPQPSKSDQIAAFARDPELARQVFKKQQQPASRRHPK